MKSKISFFNKTIFQKNITLYWPIWVLYTVILIFAQPVMFWSENYFLRFYDTFSYYDKLENLVEVLYLDMHVYLIAFVALASGMALFHYLYNSKSANMIHAFPVDRTQLFGTNVVSGLFFLAVPQTISSILLAIVALCSGVMEIHYVLFWWLLSLGTDVVAMAVVTFCAMFTGHLMALPVYAVIVNYFSYLVYYLIYITVTVFGFGISELGRKAERITAFFSPTECFLYNIGICEKYNEMGNCTGALVYGVEILLIYLVVAVVLYAVAYITYKKRHVEQAGEFITVGWVKPIFRYGITLGGGFFGSILMREFLHEVGSGCNMVMFVILLILLGGISYFVADMFIHKSFHVFKAKNWRNCGICIVAIVVTFFGIHSIGKTYEDYQPELYEIANAYVDWSYEIQFEGEDAETVLALHKAILDNKGICIEAEERGGNWSYEYVRIGYNLKNGEYICRSYQIPIGYEETDVILAQITELELDVDNFLKHIFVNNYEKIDTFHGGWFEAPFVNDVYEDAEGEISISDYQSMQFTPEQAKEIYEAMIADAKAGTLMKYNIYSEWLRKEHPEDWKNSNASVMVEFQNPNEDNSTYLVIEEYSFTYPSNNVQEYVDAENWYSAHLSFGKDCENIVNKLIEFEFIESVDDIWWGEFSEEQLKYQ